MAADIPFLDLSPQTEQLWPELERTVTEVMRSGNYIGGPWVEEFEAAVEKYTGAKHAVGLNSGTDALVIGLRAIGVGAGDEVITSSFSFFATAESISILGATPVFVDIDPLTMNIDVDQIEQKINAKTKAIMPVHIFGQPAILSRVYELAEKHGLKVVEDAAQAFGAEYQGHKIGARGDISTFSFFPTKNLGAFGDGGMLVTNDDQVAKLAVSLRAHGGKNKYYNEMLGYNSRLDSIQAAVLLVKLKYIESSNEGRRAAASRYNQLLNSENVETPYEARESRHIYHQYTIRIKNGLRENVERRLKEDGIPFMRYYETPIHRLPVYKGVDFGPLPEVESASSEVISLPIWPEITESQQTKIASAVLKAL